MTEQSRLPRPTRTRAVAPAGQAESPGLSAEQAQAFAAARAARDRLVDAVRPPAAGDAEVLGGDVTRAEVRSRAHADEEYVRMFTQQGGE